MANNRVRVRGLESAPPGANPSMWYITPSGVWAPVTGSFDTDKVPTGTVVPDVAWATPAGGGGGSGGDFFGATGPRTTPPSTGWSWFNQRGSTIATSGRDGSQHLHVPLGNAGSGTVVSAQMRTAPATPYTIIANIEGLVYAANYIDYGLAFGNAGSELRLLYFGYVDGALNVYVVPTSGATPGAATFGPLTWRHHPTFFAIRDDGTNKKYYIGVQEEHMMEVFSEARTAQFTPTQVGFYGCPRQNTWPVDVTLWSWKEQSAAPVTT